MGIIVARYRATFSPGHQAYGYVASLMIVATYNRPAVVKLITDQVRFRHTSFVCVYFLVFFSFLAPVSASNALKGLTWLILILK